MLEPKVQVEQGYLVFIFCAVPMGSSATVNRTLTTLAGAHWCKESSDIWIVFSWACVRLFPRL